MAKQTGDSKVKAEGDKAPEEVDLRKLHRVQLLRLLRDATEENERLSAELAATKERLAQAERELESRRIAIDDSESLAEASLRLAGVFAAAQHAIDLYGYNVAQNKAEAAAPSAPATAAATATASAADANPENAAGGGRARSAAPEQDGSQADA